MDNVKNDLFYLEKLREDLKFIVAHLEGFSQDLIDSVTEILNR